MAKLTSETIEPYMAQCIGVWFETLENTPDKTIEDYKVFWYKVRALDRMTIVAETPHASLAIMNHLGKIARYIKEKTGEDAFKWDR